MYCFTNSLMKMEKPTTCVTAVLFVNFKILDVPSFSLFSTMCLLVHSSILSLVVLLGVWILPNELKLERLQRNLNRVKRRFTSNWVWAWRHTTARINLLRSSFCYHIRLMDCVFFLLTLCPIKVVIHFCTKMHVERENKICDVFFFLL